MSTASEDTFAASNAALVPGLQQLLRAVLPQAAVHARLLNTLSLLEHMGSQKIMATQAGHGISQPTLKHLAEETRHAWFFKRAAERTAGRSLEYSRADLLAAGPARWYFGRLEASIAGGLPKARRAEAVYLFMSLVIEYRALWFYRHYEDELREAGIDLSLRRVLAEENGHLLDMQRRLQAIGELRLGQLEGFLSVEEKLFRRLLVHLQQQADWHVQASAIPALTA